MVRRRAIGYSIIAASIAAIVLSAIWYQGRDRRAIRRLFNQAVELIQLHEPEDALTSTGKARALSRMVATNFTLSVQEIPSRTVSRPELTAMLLKVRTQAEVIEIDVRESTVRVDPESDVAHMEVTAYVAARMSAENLAEYRQAVIDWTRTADGWQMTGVREDTPITNPD